MNIATKKKIRIKSYKRDALPNLWKELSNADFIELILNSASKDISILFSHMNSSSINITIEFLTNESVEHIFSALQANAVNKIISACNENGLLKILTSLDYETKENTLKKCNQAQRNRLVDLLSDAEKKEIMKKISSEKKEQNSYGYYTSSSFDNLLQSSVVDRIKELEEREAILEKNYKQRESILNERIASTSEHLIELEAKIKAKQEEFVAKENEYVIKQFEVQEKINKLEKEHQELQQARLQIKFPEYVDTAVEGLRTKGKFFEKKAFWWNFQGGAALLFSILAAIATFLYGGYQFNHAAKVNIDWLFFLFLLLKGLIIVTLFGAWAKHAFNVANAYVHEALKRSDRMHAISFGKFYLEVYGNKVDQKEMKDIFENWNINTDSAFTKITDPDFSVKQLEQISSIVDSLRKIKIGDVK
ncbi:hypothetical protein [Leclercia sp.]|uniref:hypothetical protein n=1 Tax=Leclercia sp. TaxID=1898428 RepID=UPI0028BDBB59|nr:hypothetical protein [Leclercia sp.]